MFVFQVNNFHSRKIFCVSYFFHVAKQQLRNNEITFEICLFFQSHFIYAGNTLGSSNRTIRISGKWMTIKYISHNTILIFCTEAQSLNHPTRHLYSLLISTRLNFERGRFCSFDHRAKTSSKQPQQHSLFENGVTFSINCRQTHSSSLSSFTLSDLSSWFFYSTCLLFVCTLNLWKWET